MSKWTKFRALSFRDRILLLQILLLLPVTGLGLAILGLKKFHSLLRKYPLQKNTPQPGQAGVAEAKHLAYLVSAAARHGLYHATCLRQSLLLWWLLRRRGIESELRIGVQKTGNTVLAHAWITVNGIVVTEGEDIDKRFAAFDGVQF